MDQKTPQISLIAKYYVESLIPKFGGLNYAPIPHVNPDKVGQLRILGPDKIDPLAAFEGKKQTVGGEEITTTEDSSSL